MKKVSSILLRVSIIAFVSLVAWLLMIPNMYLETYQDGSTAFLYFADCKMEDQTVMCKKVKIGPPVYFETGVKSLELLERINEVNDD